MSNTTNYTVLARRYRPQTFEDVIGQNHVGTALRNAIKAGRVAHAYLFTGARGVGKTSMARILAKALNCPHTVEGVPCNQCDICEGITSGQDVDIQEIDGASNRGIDDIRSLRANVGVKSMRTKYKIYIIDEVHMLTKEAFNALLKTLEEPPPNVKFVFCTTEPHKVPDTILSRCQRFDFSSIDLTNIILKLTEIAEKEGINVDPEAVELVARRAGGSMRDSQSLFDQLLAFGNEHVSAADVNRLLGTASDERLCSILEAAFQHQTAESLQLLSESLSQGVQVTNLADQLILCVRDMMVQAAGALELPLLGVGELSKERLSILGKAVGLMTINASLQILADVKSKMSRVVSPRPLLELAIVRITLLEELSVLKDVVQQLRSNPGQPAVVHLHQITGTHQPQLLSEQKSGKPLDQQPRKTFPEQDARTANLGSVGKMARVEVPVEAKKPTNLKSDLITNSENHPENKIVSPTQHPMDELPTMTVWQKLMTNQDHVTQSLMGHVETLAIIEPSQLEIVFPARYKFSKIELEKKVDILQQLESGWSILTGKKRKFKLKSLQDNVLEEKPKPFSPESKHHHVDHQDVEKDPFLKKVEQIFQANLIKVDKLLPE